MAAGTTKAPWYLQDPNDLAKTRWAEVRRYQEGASRCRALLASMEGAGLSSALQAERERLTIRLHECERIAASMTRMARAFERLAQKNLPAGQLEAELQQMLDAG